MKIPLHPLVIHFPIAFIYGALFFTGLQLIKPNWTCRIVGLWMLGLSSITSVLASITGQWEMKKARSSDYSSAIHEILDKGKIISPIIKSAPLSPKEKDADQTEPAKEPEEESHGLAGSEPAGAPA